MKRVSSMFLAIAITALMSVSMLGQAANFKEHFNFNNDILIGKTLVKKGRYLVKYDSSASQISVFDGEKLIVQVPATAKQVDRKFDSDAILTADSAEGIKLTGFRLGGQRQELMLTEATVLSDN